nr:RNA-directed DNA polymerase, eukaryota [Tanacetum cinerariifolium]
ITKLSIMSKEKKEISTSETITGGVDRRRGDILLSDEFDYSCGELFNPNNSSLIFPPKFISQSQLSYSSPSDCSFDDDHHDPVKEVEALRDESESLRVANTKKDIKGISPIHELNKIIEVGTTLGYDVKGCKKSLDRMINGIGYWNNEVGDCFVINIYGPQESAAKSSLWNRLAELMNQHNGKFILFGDFNTVLHEYERSGSIGVMEDIPNIKVTAIERLWSDHSPILLHSKKANFGPFPFKLYNSWLSRDGFDDTIKSTWDSMETGYGSNKISSHKSANLSEIHDIEKKIDDGSASISDREKRIKLLQDIDKLENLEALDLIQKARIKWDIEGDENSKLFHRIINSKRRTQAIAGILHDGDWITEPPLIKDVFLNYYKDKFQAHDSQECGSNKAPGLDGANSFFMLISKISNPLFVKDFRLISLIGTHYKIISKLLANRLSKVIDKVVSKEQSAFISGRQILDGPLIISDIIQWYKKRKKKMLIFKVDFEKAFDSVSWKYLDFILDSLDFGSKWRSWITACLHSSRAFIFINDSFGVVLKILGVWHGLNGLKFSLLSKKEACKLVGRGTRVYFWKDIWIGDLPLYTRYNRLYRLDQDKDCLIIDRIVNGQWQWNWSRSDIGTHNTAYLNDLLLEIIQIDVSVDEDTCTWVLSNDGTFSVKSARRLIDSKLLPSISTPTVVDEDTCTWVLSNDGTFSVKSARRLIDLKLLPSISTPTVWDKFLPRKVNIFLWRLSLDRLPHRLNLSSRSLDIPTISCSSCNGNVESADHVFFECDLVKEIWRLVCKWCDISIPMFASYDTWSSWFSTWQATKAKSRRLYIIFAALFWWIWRYRNIVTFSSDSIKKGDLFDNIRASTFSWISNRGHVLCNWVEWLKNPFLIAGS